jgi:hypothetical protein
MGVRRLFSRGGQNFPGGGARARYYFYYTILFFPKKSKNILFLAGRGRPGGGQEPPLALPCGRPWREAFQNCSFFDVINGRPLSKFQSMFRHD